METLVATPTVEAPVAATTTTTTVTRHSNTIFWVALGIALLIILVVIGIYAWRRASEKKPATT
ncbi:ZipA incomplete domain containing protein [Pandoravirus salinus]|uniref:ZipA incomplete domain containing protein n=1 Tax=Pandoravirus salinus TaxID=1349410 RepID=S4W0J7_9VIRU|nr:ZipA superfamily incomplete domain [Pandoravirus salinus]AGO83610.1 ZipA incomplete domain containing protein [Pandoravirus salinus]